MKYTTTCPKCKNRITVETDMKITAVFNCSRCGMKVKFETEVIK